MEHLKTAAMCLAAMVLGFILSRFREWGAIGIATGLIVGVVYSVKLWNSEVTHGYPYGWSPLLSVANSLGIIFLRVVPIFLFLILSYALFLNLNVSFSWLSNRE